MADLPVIRSVNHRGYCRLSFPPGRLGRLFCETSLAARRGENRQYSKIKSRLFIDQQAMFTSASALSESLSLFIFLRFIAGVFTSGFLVPRFVYCVEIVSTANHSFFGIIIKLFAEPVGGCILAILAAWVTNWRHLMLVVSLPCFLPLIFWW